MVDTNTYLDGAVNDYFDTGDGRYVIDLRDIMQRVGAATLEDLPAKLSAVAMDLSLGDAYKSPHARQVGAMAVELLAGLKPIPEAEALNG